MMDQGLTFILFGATGDLARKKIIPALFELSLKKVLPTSWRAVLFIRKTWHDAELREFVSTSVRSMWNNARSDHIEEFTRHLTLFNGDLNDPMSFEWLRESLSEYRSDQRLFFLSVSPALYQSVIENIRKAGLADGRSKILIEKPFGRSQDEAKKLTKLLRSFVGEDQIFRIDHYLGKDAMSEIENYQLLNKSGVRRVEARIIESQSIENRGAFYDSLGALIDVGQNHLLMMLASALCHFAHYESKLVSLQSLAVASGAERGQYVEYREEKDVRHGSVTETYFSSGLTSGDIECLIEGGKAFDRSVSEVVVTFNDGELVRVDFNKMSEDLRPHSKIIGAAIRGDHDSFVSAEETEEEWRIAEEILPILRAMPLRVYPKGVKYEHNLFK